MRFPTRVIGNATKLKSRVVSTKFVQLVGVTGYNSGADCFIQIHETATLPADGAVPVFSFPADQARPINFEVPGTCVDLSACTVCASSTSDTKTLIAGNDVSIQAIVAG